MIPLLGLVVVFVFLAVCLLVGTSWFTLYSILFGSYSTSHLSHLSRLCGVPRCCVVSHPTPHSLTYSPNLCLPFGTGQGGGTDWWWFGSALPAWALFYFPTLPPPAAPFVDRTFSLVFGLNVSMWCLPSGSGWEEEGGVLPHPPSSFLPYLPPSHVIVGRKPRFLLKEGDSSQLCVLRHVFSSFHYACIHGHAFCWLVFVCGIPRLRALWRDIFNLLAYTSSACSIIHLPHYLLLLYLFSPWWLGRCWDILSIYSTSYLSHLCGTFVCCCGTFWFGFGVAETDFTQFSLILPDSPPTGTVVLFIS